MNNNENANKLSRINNITNIEQSKNIIYQLIEEIKIERNNYDMLYNDFLILKQEKNKLQEENNYINDVLINKLSMEKTMIITICVFFFGAIIGYLEKQMS